MDSFYIKTMSNYHKKQLQRKIARQLYDKTYKKRMKWARELLEIFNQP